MTDALQAVPEEFARCMAEVYGEAGTAWIDRLPAIVAACAHRWSLTVAPPFVPLSYNYVAPAAGADGTPFVLKIGFPCRELTNEIEALRIFDGHGIARLVAFDHDDGALLLERLLPGTPIDGLDDDRATLIAAGVMQRLWRPAPAGHPFPTTADWGKGFVRLRQRFDGGAGPLPSALVARAESLFDELHASAAEPVLLHGDLHHLNILAAGPDRYLAIDPKGLVGEPAYETGALLRNPRPWLLAQAHPGRPRILARRIGLLSDVLGFDRRRLRDWGLAQAVLSGWWSIEDHGRGWEQAIAYAEYLAAVPL